MPRESRTRLLLRDAQGHVLMQSDGRSAGDGDNVIDQHLPAGTYLLEVVSTGGAGNYALTTTLTPSSSPFQSLALTSKGYSFFALAVGDFNDDGIPDLVGPDGIQSGSR